MRLRERTTPRSRQEVRLRLEGTTFSNLEDYRHLYREEYGQEIELPDLASEILSQFLTSDRAFRRWQRARARSGSDADAAKAAEEPDR